MAEVTRTWHWESYRPDLGDNRELQRPFFLRVKAGLSKTELEAWRAKAMELRRSLERGEPGSMKDLLELLEPMVQLGDEPLTICGKPITSFEQYLTEVSEISGAGGVAEIAEAISYFNSVRGARELFYGRLSGGIASTASPLSAPKTAAPSNGAPTSGTGSGGTTPR